MVDLEVKFAIYSFNAGLWLYGELNGCTTCAPFSVVWPTDEFACDEGEKTGITSGGRGRFNAEGIPVLVLSREVNGATDRFQTPGAIPLAEKDEEQHP